MDFKQLQSFVAVANYNSFSKAAENLFISQPTISTHINQLEKELNTRLITRTTKNIKLTDRGKELYSCAQSILLLKDNLLKHWEDENNRLLNIGSSTIPSTYILPEILPAYKKLHPDFQFVVHQSDSQKIISSLLNDKFELGLVGMNDHREGIEYIPFYEDQMVLITPVCEPYITYKTSGTFPTKQLKSTPIILREQGSGSKKCVEGYFEHIGISESELLVSARLNDQESIKQLVAGGLGISIISKKAAMNYVETNRILDFSLPEYTAKRHLYLVHKKDYILRDQVKDFIKFICEFYN